MMKVSVLCSSRVLSGRLLSSKHQATPLIARRSLASLPFKTLRVNGDRLQNDIHDTAQWGRGVPWGHEQNETGMSRLALSDHDRQVRDWFVQTTRSLGCNVVVDEMGNIFAVRKGRMDGPPTYAGSHLDTQPTGGRYDGILGVCSGIEMLRTLHENNHTTEFPVGVVNWTNEEGARFPISMISSGVWAGKIPLEKAHNLKEVGGRKSTVKEELQNIGYLGELKANHKNNPIGAHFELHIEQGPILEAHGQKVGIVSGVQAYRWHTVEVRGRDCHTGTTDFANRSDAMLATAKLILHSHRLAAKWGCLASTGIISALPGSTNTVPGLVRFSLDIRATSIETLMKFEEQLKHDSQQIVKNVSVDDLNNGGVIGKGCDIEWILDSTTDAIDFNGDCIKCVRESARELFGDRFETATRTMISGAGHDSVFTNARAPTSMIFVPCREGISHNPAEYCSPEDCEIGAQVLLGAVLRYDKLRSKSREVKS